MVTLYLTLGNGSGVDLERQVNRHHRLALVTLPLTLTLTLDAPLDVRSGYSFNLLHALKQGRGMAFLSVLMK